MATYSQLPGDLNLELVKGDEFPFAATFNLDLTGYTLSAGVVNAATLASVGTPTITMTTATSGGTTTTTVSFLLTETQTTALVVGTRYRWFFRWVSPLGVTRTVLSGVVRVTNP